ncbi:DinB family protein [Eisenibacter elegans]|jgi:hypothetical protein|uniref:DinB family protein n=1 Tax=Eisenibacter elegans TaxID=997 RepID=UPI00042043A8|nr:DinB family protein [Eisenibacter elegans]
MTQQEHLSAIAEQLRSVINTTQKAFVDLSPEEFNHKPSPKQWSIAECMQHLLIVYKKYKTQLPQKIHAKAPQAASLGAAFEPSYVGKLFKGLVNPNKKRKTPAPPTLHPSKGSTYPLDLQGDFLGYLHEVLDYVEQAQKLNIDLNKVYINSSLGVFLRFNLGDYFEIEALHSSLHLAQMQRVKAGLKH